MKLKFWESKKKSVSEEGDDTEPRDIHQPRIKKMTNWRRLLESTLNENVFPTGNLDAGTEFDDRLFRNLATASPLDLPPEFIQTSQRLSLLLYRKNPRAFNCVEVIKDFVIGDGFRVTAKHEEVQKVLDEHIALNHWNDRSTERLRSLSLFGEQLYPVKMNGKDFINDNGIVRISSISPLNIKSVNRNTQNAEEMVSVTVGMGKGEAAGSAFQPGTTTGVKHVVFDIIQAKGDGTLGIVSEKESGNAAFYTPVNRVSGATRGTSDLLSSIDWLEGLDGFVFALMERAEAAQSVVYDILYEGQDQRGITERVKTFAQALRAGGVYGHNEKTTLKVQSPKLGANDAKEMVGILARQVQAGTRLAGLFYGDSEDLTRASAAELSIPVAKMIIGRQVIFKRMLGIPLEYQIQVAKGMGRLDPGLDEGFEIELPRVFLRDMSTVASALDTLTGALGQGVDRKWIDNDQAGMIYRTAIEEFNVVVGEPNKSLMESHEKELTEMYSNIRGENGSFERSR